MFSFSNALAVTPVPRVPLVGPKLAIMDKSLGDLDAVLEKLHKQFRRMATVMDSLETLLIEAHKSKGSAWAQEEPLWVTWSLEKFVTRITELLVPYHRSLHQHVQLVDTLRSHNVFFQDSKTAITQWIDQVHLLEQGWSAKWEDICIAEVDKW